MEEAQKPILVPVEQCMWSYLLPEHRIPVYVEYVLDHGVCRLPHS